MLLSAIFVDFDFLKRVFCCFANFYFFYFRHFLENEKNSKNQNLQNSGKKRVSKNQNQQQLHLATENFNFLSFEIEKIYFFWFCPGDLRGDET